MKAIIGERYSEKLLKPLITQGFQVILIPDNPLIDSRLAGHVDLSAIVTGSSSIVVSEHLRENEAFVNILTISGYDIFRCKNKQSEKYPYDAALCACICDGVLIHNTNVTDPAIIDSHNGKIIHVNQGYSKCCICTVGNHNVITSDKGIANKLISEDFSVLEIEQGLVQLEGFDYGFIGGASFKSGNTVYFTGRFPEKAELMIESYLNNCGVNFVYLTNEPAFDVGGVLVI